MNYGSVCSGVEAATLAWAPLGWKAVFFAEVEPFPAAVLQQRFGATRPLRLLPPAEAETEKERKQRESWEKQIAELPEGITLICRPVWVSEDSGATDIGMQFLHSPDTDVLNRYIKVLYKDSQHPEDISNQIVENECQFI